MQNSQENTKLQRRKQHPVGETLRNKKDKENELPGCKSKRSTKFQREQTWPRSRNAERRKKIRKTRIPHNSICPEQQNLGREEKGYPRV